MTSLLRQTVAAVGLAAMSLAASAASYTYDFKTFFDTSTPFDPFDTKTLSYSIATLTIADIAGGVQLTLKQNPNTFPGATGPAPFLGALYLAGPNGTLSGVSGVPLATTSKYSTLLPFVKDGSYSYRWDIEFKPSTFTDGLTSVVNIKGAADTAQAFAKAGTTPMINMTNVGKPYANFLGANVHFIGSLRPAIPEPSTYLMMGLGLVGVAAMRRRTQKAN